MMVSTRTHPARLISTCKQRNRVTQLLRAIAMFFHGIGVARDYSMAVDFFHRSAEQGDDQGQMNLGYMYEHGLGVAAERSVAAFWYGKAADQGHVRALERLRR
jgi:TPR repeat protein